MLRSFDRKGGTRTAAAHLRYWALLTRRTWICQVTSSSIPLRSQALFNLAATLTTANWGRAAYGAGAALATASKRTAGSPLAVCVVGGLLPGLVWRWGVAQLLMGCYRGR